MTAQVPKIVGMAQDKVKQIMEGKTTIKQVFNPAATKIDKRPLIDEEEEEEEEEEVDELSGGGQLPKSGGTNIYSFRETNPASAYQNKLLVLAEKHCICCSCVKKRWQLALLANLGFLIVFGIRCNFGAAKVRMNRDWVNPRTNVTELRSVHWSGGVLGIIEGSFFYGYLITQIPGGFLASRVAANKLFGIAIGLASFFNLLVPGACVAGYGFVIATQVMQGFVQGVTYPACHGIWRFWAPPMERSKLATTAFTGSYAGAVIGMPLSAIMTSKAGWPSSFYLYGVMGIIWSVLWMAFTFERPACHPTISEEERIYIETSIGEKTAIQPTFRTLPWKAVLTSKPVWAIIVANFCRSWTFYLLLNHQILYFRDVLNLHIIEGGYLAALPHFVMAIVVLVGGQLADYLRSSNRLSTTSVRKIFNCGGFGLEGLFLLVVGYSKSETGAVIALVLAVGASGFAISGFNVNHLDIAPRYASILMGMSNGIGTFSGMICPVVTEKLIHKYGKEGWKTVFLIAGLVHLTGITFYAIFASGEKQPWAEPPEEEETWRPDDFAVKAAQTGKFTSYGAAGENAFAPLPTADELREKPALRNGPHNDSTADTGHDYGQQYFPPQSAYNQY